MDNEIVITQNPTTYLSTGLLEWNYNFNLASEFYQNFSPLWKGKVGKGDMKGSKTGHLKEIHPPWPR